MDSISNINGLHRILFVCMGNICRSPTAEGIFRHRLNELGLSKHFEHDSCGTHDYHIGSPPDHRAIEHAQKRGVDIRDLRGRQVSVADFKRFDLILAADRHNLSILKQLCPASEQSKLRLMLDFSTAYQGQEVPDPYYGGAAGFELVLDQLEEVAAGLIEHFRR